MNNANDIIADINEIRKLLDRPLKDKLVSNIINTNLIIGNSMNKQIKSLTLRNIPFFTLTPSIHL